MSLSSSAPWLKYYGNVPHHLSYPQKTIYQMVKAAAERNPKLPAYEFMGKKTTFTPPELTISFTGVGIEGGCPAEKDNVGCYYLKDGTFTLVPAEKITANKEFCDCEFAWRFAGGAHGVSLGKMLPAIPEEETTHYEKAAFTVENAAVIPCMQVLGAYQVTFER
mgnify:CR=1 FL=1